MSSVTTPESESASLLSLSNKVSGSFYLLALLLGLSGLVLAVQKPIASDAEIARARFSLSCAGRIESAAGDQIAQLFSQRAVDLSWPFKDIAIGYTRQPDASGRAEVLHRFLNEQGSERERHLQILIQIPEAGAIIRDSVEDELLRSETVTVPILQSRIASGDFALSIAVLFVVIHLYGVCHRDFLYAARRHMGRSALRVVPSLLAADADDLGALPKRDQLFVHVFQLVFLYGSPFILGVIILFHFLRIGASISGNTRIFVADLLCFIYGAVFAILWFRRRQVEPIQRLWPEAMWSRGATVAKAEIDSAETAREPVADS